MRTVKSRPTKILWEQASVSVTKWDDTPVGVLRFELDRGVPLEPQNPYPSLRVIGTEKGTHFKGFFLKNMPIFQKFGLSQKSWPMLKDFLVKNGTHV